MVAPTGLGGGQTAWSCGVDDAPRWHAGVSYGYVDTDIELDGGRLRYEFSEHVLGATFRAALEDGWSVGASVGAIAAGTLTDGARSFDVLPGIAVAINGSREWLRGNAYDLFLATTLTLGGAFATTREVGQGPRRQTLWATDVRLDVTFGVTVANVWSPYVAVRAFGGPFGWTLDGEHVVGNDRHFHTLAVGSLFTFADGLDLFVDWGFEGALSAAAGVGASF
jgi:hypothetical protein